MQQSQPSLITHASSYLLDALWSLTNLLSCFPSTPTLRINSRPFKILRLLGEGGFSYVYLVQTPGDPTLYALKKIRCPFGQESVALALREVEAYALFSPHENIIRALEHEVVDDGGGDGSKTVYILLPYYRRGNLQDAINANLVNRGRFPERRLMVLFLGVCRALRAMHRYEVKGGDGSRKKARNVRREAAVADREAEEEVRAKGRGKGKKKTQVMAGGEDGEDDVEFEPLMEGEIMGSQEGVGEGQARAYAHRDIKPGNIMISDSGTQPVVMDLGSLAPSPTPITSRAMALQVQDQAAEHSTMPYRAPELFDVKTGTTIDGKVDIWSVGCTLYACLVGKSPFEARSEETGGSLSICVLGGDWRFPDEGPQEIKRGKQRVVDEEQQNQKKDDTISEPVKEVVRRCLRVEPAERPDIDELITLIEEVIGQMPPDHGGEDAGLEDL
jgi:serine/threonine kinase 16